ncbi:MAG: hypothetical protein HY299_20345 [Verrucomicrobia bacterium]|nr:hypothetical protein [Verrucomicrobiota bacterium]
MSSPPGRIGLTERTARTECERFIRLLPSPSQAFDGRGVILCAGGTRYFTCAWVCIQRLRQSGCALPIELWYLGDDEMTDEMIQLLEPWGVVCVDAHQVRATHPFSELGGWELKAYAIARSRFAEVLFLDADNVVVRNPEYLFDTREYLETGAMFWPDYGRFEKTEEVWRLLGMDRPDHPEFESGQMLIDKRRCWEPLRLALWFNEHSDFFYRFLHGDKETFHLAWRKWERPFHFIHTPIHTVAWTMCQHDPSGERLFQHRNSDKWSLHLTNPRVDDFWFDDECRDAIANLRIVWDGNRSRLPKARARRRPPTLRVVLLTQEHRTMQRDATLKEWQGSDARAIPVEVLTRATDPLDEEGAESEQVFSALTSFLERDAEYLLLLADDLEISSFFWSALRSWRPWIDRQFKLGSVYHPGTSERVCDVDRRADWIETDRIYSASALLVSKSVAALVVKRWAEVGGHWARRIALLCDQELVAFHNPSLVQNAGRGLCGFRSHEAPSFVRSWRPGAAAG